MSDNNFGRSQIVLLTVWKRLICQVKENTSKLKKFRISVLWFKEYECNSESKYLCWSKNFNTMNPSNCYFEDIHFSAHLLCCWRQYVRSVAIFETKRNCWISSNCRIDGTTSEQIYSQTRWLANGMGSRQDIFGHLSNIRHMSISEKSSKKCEYCQYRPFLSWTQQRVGNREYLFPTFMFR